MAAVVENEVRDQLDCGFESGIKKINLRLCLSGSVLAALFLQVWSNVRTISCSHFQRIVRSAHRRSNRTQGRFELPWGEKGDRINLDLFYSSSCLPVSVSARWNSAGIRDWATITNMWLACRAVLAYSKGWYAELRNTNEWKLHVKTIMLKKE